MSDFEEALRNIDAFCKILVQKMLDENQPENNTPVEPMEKLLLRKYIVEESSASSPLAKTLIPLAQAEEPLVDVFEDENYVRVLMQCNCKDQKIIVHTDVAGIEICKRECLTDDKGVEVCSDKCQKLDVRVKDLQINDMTSKCSNNTVFEIDIPKKS